MFDEDRNTNFPAVARAVSTVSSQTPALTHRIFSLYVVYVCTRRHTSLVGLRTFGLTTRFLRPHRRERRSAPRAPTSWTAASASNTRQGKALNSTCTSSEIGIDATRAQARYARGIGLESFSHQQRLFHLM